MEFKAIGLIIIMIGLVISVMLTYTKYINVSTLVLVMTLFSGFMILIYGLYKETVQTENKIYECLDQGYILIAGGVEIEANPEIIGKVSIDTSYDVFFDDTNKQIVCIRKN